MRQFKLINYNAIIFKCNGGLEITRKYERKLRGVRWGELRENKTKYKPDLRMYSGAQP